MTSNKLLREAEAADREVMARCAPGRMSPIEAREYLELVIDNCKSAIEALVDENPDLKD